MNYSHSKNLQWSMEFYTAYAIFFPKFVCGIRDYSYNKYNIHIFKLFSFIYNIFFIYLVIYLHLHFHLFTLFYFLFYYLIYLSIYILYIQLQFIQLILFWNISVNYFYDIALTNNFSLTVLQLLYQFKSYTYLV